MKNITKKDEGIQSKIKETIKVRETTSENRTVNFIGRLF